MKKTLKYIVAAVASCALLAACNENKFLDVTNPTAIGEGNFPANISQVESFLATAYGSSHCYMFLGNQWPGYLSYALDHTLDFQHREDDWNQMASCRVTASTSKCATGWDGMAVVIHNTNTALEAILNYEESDFIKDEEADQVKVYEGEVRYLRCMYWWWFQEMFGQPDADGVGIPLLTHSVDSYAASQVGRAKSGDVYNMMISELQTAITLLAGQKGNNRHADQWAAKGLLAKVYWALGDYTNCAATCLDIIRNSGKTLASFTQYYNMYNGDAAYEHPSESLFEIENVLGTSGNGYGYWNPGTSMSMFYSQKVINTSGSRKSVSYCNQYAHDRNIVRFGYTEQAPLHFLETSTEEPDSEMKTLSGGTWYYLPQSYLDAAKAMQQRAIDGQAIYATDPDPRFFVGIFFPYINYCKDTSNGTDDWPIAQNYGSGNWWTTGSGNSIDEYAFSTRKYQFINGALQAHGKLSSPENTYFMRLPEIYLLYAQCIKDSDPSTALEYVNKVHRRAYGKPVDSKWEYDYASLSARTKTADATDHLANDPLLYEVWAELFAEMRWWDYVRHYKMGPEESAYYKSVRGPSTDGSTEIVWNDRVYTMPVPSGEFEKNANPEMVQTPGY